MFILALRLKIKKLEDGEKKNIKILLYTISISLCQPWMCFLPNLALSSKYFAWLTQIYAVLYAKELTRYQNKKMN